MTKNGLTILGDIMPGRYVEHTLFKRGFSSVWEPIRPYLEGRVVLANLECPLTNQVPAKKFGPILTASPERAGDLKHLGFAALSLANNHIFDCGVEGMVETRNALDAVGIAHTGAGMNQTEAVAPVLFEVNGVHIGMLAFSYTPAASDSCPGVAHLYGDFVQETIAAAKARVDFLIIMAHAGMVLTRFPLPRERNIYRCMVDWGADLIVGGHPHCVQVMECYQGKRIYYSLGDALFDHHEDEVWAEFWAPTSHPKRFGLEADRSWLRESIMLHVDMIDGECRVSHQPLLSNGHLILSPLDRSRREVWETEFARWGIMFAEDPTVSRRCHDLQEALFADLERRGLK